MGDLGGFSWWIVQRREPNNIVIDKAGRYWKIQL
jgi:hypothetical protein